VVIDYTRAVNDSILKIRGAGLLGLLLAVLLAWLPGVIPTDSQLAGLFGSGTDGLLTVAFLDVGQGDAIYIETPDGVQLLIDGGPDSSVLRELGKVMPLFDRTIDVILATHPDKDHIGGLVDVLARYQVGEIVMTENENDTAVSEAFIEGSRQERVKIEMARAGQEFRLGASTTLRVFSPSADPSALESNTSSIVAQLRFGEIEFMLTGDAPISIEEYLVSTYGNALVSEVLKLGHHGSRTSTADSFLKAVQPTYAIVSAGKDSRYGHPHKEVVELVNQAGAEIFSTAKSGTIIFKSDGDRVWVE
jgi:competence protein ComEC